jgi:Cu/Ag efflux protein CusF
MKHISKLAITALAILPLASCGGENTEKMDHSKMTHSDSAKMNMTDETGHTTGVIMSISPDGNVATINHQAIESVGMNAMTMGFGVTSEVDLSEFSKGDNVSFMIKKGRDNGYRIIAICNTDLKGNECLNSIMDHNDH